MCKILLISGHGAGDPGAMGTLNGVTYKEADLTRELTELIQPTLEQEYGAAVERYPIERNAYADFMSNRLALDLTGYHYILEVHFNAFQKNADGDIKGMEIYTTYSRKDTATERYILDKVRATGIDTDRGLKRYDWSVIAAAERKKSPAALLEVCFIDDEDDMKKYLADKGKIARAIADGIAAGLLLERKAGDDMRYMDVKTDAWYAAAVEKVSEAGLMQGSDGKFRPNDPVTRAELATVLSRLLEK